MPSAVGSASRPYPCRTETDSANPSTGMSRTYQVSWTAAKSIPAFSTRVNATTNNPPTSPPSSAPKAAVPMRDRRAPALEAERPAPSGAPAT